MDVLITAYSERQEQISDLMISQSWLTAKLNRAEKLPNLNELLGKKEKKELQTDEQMLNTVKMLHAALGGD